jgi:hypothetical protein
MSDNVMVCTADDHQPANPTHETRLALVTSHKLKEPVRLKVAFIDKPKPPAKIRHHILEHMNAWSEFCDVRFAQSTNNPEVRITFRGTGLWSYIGTGILTFPADKPTMCLENFDSPNVQESDIRRGVRHETGHTLGFAHEHLRASLIAWIDRPLAIQYYRMREGWDEETTVRNVLTPLRDENITATADVDVHSIMCYGIPQSILKPGAPRINGGQDFSQFDRDMAATVYPFPPGRDKDHLVYSKDFPGVSLNVEIRTDSILISPFSTSQAHWEGRYCWIQL